MSKKLAPIAAIPVALFALAACGQSEEEQFLESMGCEDGQTAEECGQAMADDMDPAPGADIEDSDVWVGEGEMPPQYVGISDGMTSVDRTYTGRMGSEVSAELGEPVEIDQSAFVEHGDFVGTLTLDRVEAIDSCDTGNGEYAVADGRQMVQAWFTIDTTESGETFDFSGPHFKAPDDSAENAEEASIHSEYDLYMCQNQPGQPEDVAPGHEVERTLFFDLPSPDSPITYTSGLFDVTWEESASADDAVDHPESEPSDSDLPDAQDIDFFGPISDPSELMADITTLEDCETADMIWGGLMNGEIEGLDIDQDYLAELEAWMQENDCW